jgi:hypothetical protein
MSSEEKQEKQEKLAKQVTGEELEVMLTEWDQPLVVDAYATWYVYLSGSAKTIADAPFLTFCIFSLMEQVRSLLVDGTGIRGGGSEVKGQGALCQD